MHSAKFIEVLRSFSAQEFKTFGVFLKSPYFNTEKLPVKLYEMLKKHYPEFSSRSLDKEIVFTKLYPGKPYNDKLMRNISSDMLKLEESFISAESNRKDELKLKILLMNEFSKRKITNLYERNREKSEALLKKTETEDIDYFKNRLELERSKRAHAIIHRDIYIDQYSNEQVISDLVTTVSILEITYRNLQMINNQKKFNYDYNLNFEEEIDNFLINSGSRFLDITYIKYLHYTYKLMRTQDEKYYRLLKEFVSGDFEKLPRDVKRDIYISLTNYCYVRITAGDDDFIKELFLNYQEMVSKDLFTTAAGNIPNVFFMNVVTTGLESGETEWVEKFIAEDGHKLKDESKEDTLNFCKANLSYFKGDYGTAFRYLSKITTDDMTYKHNVRSLTLKLYFDTNEIEPFLSHIDSYRHFIAGNKLVFDKIKDSLNNYITFAKRIFCIKNKIGKFDEFDLPNLKKEITECTPIINRPWLLRKILELEKTL
jgi:hypothetical protein